MIFQVANRLIDNCSVYVVTRRIDKSWPEREVISGINVLRYTAHIPRLLPSRLIYIVEALTIIKTVRMISREANRIVFNFFDPRPAQVYAAMFLRHGSVGSIVCSLGGTMSEQATLQLKKLAARSSDVVVGISNYVVHAFGVPHLNTHVYYPVGREPTDFGERSACFESKRVLTVCRVHPRKNLEVVIDVALRLPELLFTVVGDCTRHREYYASLIDKIDALDIQNVRFSGEMPCELLQQEYSNSSLFFLPTHHEMFGLVFAQAMSYGLPIVAPNHTAIPEAVGLSGGVLYQPGNLNECVRAIREVIGSRKRWMELSSGAKAFSEQRYAKDYMGKYAQLLLSCTH